MVSLVSHGFDLRIYIIFTKLREFGSCKDTKIMWPSSVYVVLCIPSWKEILEFFFHRKRILEFLMISFRLYTLFGIELHFWLPLGTLLMVCFMVCRYWHTKELTCVIAWFIRLGFSSFVSDSLWGYLILFCTLSFSSNKISFSIKQKNLEIDEHCLFTRLKEKDTKTLRE